MTKLLGILLALLPLGAQAQYTQRPIPSLSDLSGNLSVNQFNSGTGATSSTYWRGDGTWAAAAGGGATLGANVFSGNQTFSPDNTYDIGASGATRPRNLYVGGSGTFGGDVNVTGNTYVAGGSTGYALFFSTGTKIQNTANGNIGLYSNGGTDFGRLQLGGTTSSFPAIKRSAATIAFRLADDSADASFSAKQGSFSDRITTSADILVGGNAVLSSGSAANTGTAYKALAVGYSNNADNAYVASAFLLSTSGNFGADTLATRGGAAATWQFGAADVAGAPVAQTTRVQSASGVADTAGANWTLQGSAGTGTGAGGSLIFQVAPESTTASTKNAYATALTIASTKDITLGGILLLPSAGILSGGTVWSVNYNSNDLRMRSSLGLGWSSTGDQAGALDSNFSRISAGVIGVGTGAAGSTAGTLSAASVLVGDGSTAAPSIAFGSETGFGWYRSAASTMQLAAGGANVITFDVNSGNFTFNAKMRPSSDNARDFGESGLRWKDAYLSGNVQAATLALTEPVGASALTITGATQTASFPVLNATQTWNNAAVTFKGIYLNVTDTASASASLLADLQVGGANRFRLTKGGALYLTGGNSGLVVEAANGTQYSQLTTGGVAMQSGGTIGIHSIVGLGGVPDTYLSRGGVATWQLGAANAAAPVAQTLQAQGSRSGTDTNVGGASYTIRPGAGTGTATPAALILSTYVPVASGTGAQTATAAITLSNSLTLGSHIVTPASSGTRFLCIDTAGLVTSSASACSGT